MKTNKERQVELDRLDRAPSPNPRYKGLTVKEATWVFLKGGKRVKPKKK